MSPKSFHLRWNNHLQNLQSLFENLYNEQSLIDVTLSCSDGTLYAHKLVLSACSPYFEQIFKTNPSKHPIMILKGIKCYEMQVLLQYMYIGSVDVGEDDLEMLLDTATELQIKGLEQCNDEDLQTPFFNVRDKLPLHDPPKQSSSPTSLFPAAKDDLSWQAEIVAKSFTSTQKENDSLSKQRNELQYNVSEEPSTSKQMQHSQEDDHEVEIKPVFVKNETKSMQSTNGEYLDNSEDELRDPSEAFEEVSQPKLDNINGDINYFCHLCSRGFLNKGSHQRHMMTHAGVKPHSCTFCNQSFLRLSHLQRHIRVHTGERPYSCTQCPKQFARSDKLRQHYIIQHKGLAGDKAPKPRGRPRKHPMVFPPGPSSGSYSAIMSSIPSLNNMTMYPVSISPVTMNTH